jgi:hypothetical protein
MTIDNSDSDLLNEPQRRSLQISLRAVERLIDQCRQMRAVATRGDEAGVLLLRHAALSEAELAELQRLEEAAMKQLRLLRDAFALEPETEDLRRHLQSAFSILWADLKDERPEKLVRYGALDPNASAVLEPAIQKLVELSQQFITVLGTEGT